MALEITDLRKQADGAFYTSPRRLALTATGALCEDTDPNAATLLVAAGGQIPTEQARALGLIADPAPVAPSAHDPRRVAPQAKAAAPAKQAKGAEDKSEKAPKEDKSAGSSPPADPAAGAALDGGDPSPPSSGAPPPDEP